MDKKYILLLVVFLSVNCIGQALAQDKPVFTKYDFESSGIIRGMSGNGKWALSSSNSEGVSQTRLINLDTKAVTVLSSNKKTEYGVSVSGDGKTIVGSVSSVPAKYSVAAGKWTTLAVKGEYVYGCASSVTDDGKYAVGEIYKENYMYRIPALWDVSTGKLVDTPNLPTKDMSQRDQGMMRFDAISSDCKYILGCMSYSYIPSGEDAGGCFFFVYDREKASYKPIGFTETAKGSWTPKTKGLIAILDATMSNNGRYVTGQAHIANDVEGQYYKDEYDVPFLYDVENDSFVCYNETMAQNTCSFCVSNNGTVLSSSPVSTPVREWSVRYGQYWFSLADVLKQKYKTTFYAETGLDNTGTAYRISDDGKRVVAFPDPYSSYVVDFPVAVDVLGKGMKLLGTYSVSPEEGSEVSHLKTVTVTFDRSVTAKGAASAAQILDKDGNKVYSSVGFSATGKNVSIRFRSGALTAGEKYSLFIPEGSVAMADDDSQTNSDILISYTGRSDEAVKVESVYPEEGTAFSHIDYSTSPVLVTFDTDIAITDTASASLYRNDETEAFCSLTLARSGKKLALYPSTQQYLYNGSTYKVVVKKGSVTDVAGNNPCDELSFGYVGNYERHIDPGDTILFADNFDSGLGNFMQWCGDKNTPTSEMQAWDFTKGMAWGLVRENESSGDRMATSHSMYDPAGKSDDWLVIPQLYIPDMLCSLNFLSQSYKKAKNDVLKVIVWESNNVYSTLTADIVSQMKEEGTVIYNERQTPGENEETLGGEWTRNNLSLREFAGKNVYICFVNENEDQSAIFLDSLQVRHDMNFLISLSYEESVVDKKETSLGVMLTGNCDHIYNNVMAVLRDGDDNLVDTHTALDINLGKGQQYKFSFQTPLPLTVGKENVFYVEVVLDDEANSTKGTVKDLAFQPRKSIVLEEYTGRSCGNCPLGILAIDKMKALYGDSFIPVSIHTYGSDPVSSGLSSYTSALGLDDLGAPSGMIDRGTGCYPAVSAEVSDTYRYFFSNQDPDLPDETDKLWMDYAADEMAVPADCNIDITDVEYDDASMTFNATCEIKYALDAENLTVNLMTVLLEDSLYEYQSNYMASISSPDLGEWGLGGKYAQSTVQDFCHMDVCRNVNGTTIYGTGGYIPSSVTAGEVYTAKVSIANPYTSAVTDHCKLVVMMIDANTGKIVNAACSKHSNTEGIEEIRNSLNSQLSTLNSRAYNLAGQRVGAGAKGIVIVNGKKILR